MSKPLSIFMGYDPAQHDAYRVAEFSISRRVSQPTLITPLYLPNLTSILTRVVERTPDGQLWCPISEAPMSTEFANSRFCVPFLSATGWALFVDSDIVCLADVAELFQLADDRYAVMVVKHDHQPTETVKMKGKVQTRYPRKNWSSLILWNCDHPANLRLTKDRLNRWPGRDLHAFRWLEDEEIGSLPKPWNHLVDVDNAGGPAKLLHFTLGGCWLPDWHGSLYDYLWLEEKRILDSLCGSSSIVEFA